MPAPQHIHDSRLLSGKGIRSKACHIDRSQHSSRSFPKTGIIIRLMKLNVKTATVGKRMLYPRKASTIVASRASRGLDAILEGFRQRGIPLKLVGQHPKPFIDFCKIGYAPVVLLNFGSRYRNCFSGDEPSIKCVCQCTLLSY